ncbi:MAG: glycosyltransferase family 4 protein, partial [Actinobacteria bacterium]|nr:glycosyltransferase family 4 protein [Actinomycetota bacterium]
MKVCHLTTLHSSTDTRIFIKECVTLARAGHGVSLICMDGSTSRIDRGVHIVSLPRLESSGRIAKMRRAPKLLLAKALEIDADVYHFHDPELLSVGVDLKKRGKIVIYDSHEDVPQQILTKPWIPRYMRKLVSLIYSRVEERAVSAFDCIITVNEPIAKRFRALGVPVVILYNYPLLDDIGYADTYIDRSPLICYVGNITKLRGVDRLAEVAKLTGDPL